AARMQRGSIVITGLPNDTMQVFINSKPYRNGDTLTTIKGEYLAQATATGYLPLARSVSVPDSGRVTDVTLTMDPLNAAPSPSTSAPVASAPQNQQRHSAAAPAVIRDSGQVRLKVTPSYAEIFIEGKNI